MWKSIRRNYWLVKSFIARHYTLIFKTIGVVTLTAVVFLVLSKYIPARRDITRIGLVGKYTSETMPLTIQSQVSAGLVDIDEHGEPIPALAESWDITNDGKTYTFRLRSDMFWHDGSRLTPSDINYNFKEVSVAYGPDTVTFDLQEQFAPFLQAVSRPILKNSQIGTGGYRLEKIQASNAVLQEVTIANNTEKIIYKFYPTENSALTAFNLGEVDRLENLSFVPDEIKSDPAIKVEPNSNNSHIAVLFFNNNDSLLSSKSTRQGLAYAIRDKTFGHTRAISPIDKNSWAFNPLVKEYEFDAERANTLFYTDQQKENPPRLEIKTTLAYLDFAEAIASDWEEVLQLEVDVKVISNINSDYQVLITDYEPPKDPDQYTIWHSTQPTNFTNYSNLKVDQLLEDGRRTLDKKLRTEIYQDFQRFLLEDSPAVFLFNTTGFTLSRQ